METFKSLFQKYKQLIPVAFLMYMCIQSIIAAVRGTVEFAGIMNYFVLSEKHYLAFLLVLMSICFFFFLRPFYKYVLLLTLILGLLNVVIFTPLESKYFIFFGGIDSPKVQPKIFLIVILTYVINFKRANKFLTEAFRNSPKETLEQEEFERLERKENFKKINNYKSTDELMRILSDDRFVTEAKEAIQELLKERRGKE